MKKVFYFAITLFLTILLILMLSKVVVTKAEGNADYPELIKFSNVIVVEEWYPTPHTLETYKTGIVIIFDLDPNYHDPILVNLYQNEYFCNGTRCIWWGLFYPEMKHEYYISGASLYPSALGDEPRPVMIRSDAKYFKWLKLFLPMLDTE